MSFNGLEQFVSYLPLSHIASQLVDIYVPLATAGTVWFAQPDAMKVSHHCAIVMRMYVCTSGFSHTNHEGSKAYHFPRCTKVRLFILQTASLQW